MIDKFTTNIPTFQPAIDPQVHSIFILDENTNIAFPFVVTVNEFDLSMWLPFFISASKLSIMKSTVLASELDVSLLMNDQNKEEASEKQYTFN